MESTPMPNAEEQKQKSMEFSPIDTVEDTTGNTPEIIKDESQTKRTSFTERFAMMVGMKSRDIVEEEPKAEKGKTFGTVSTITANDQVKHGATASHGATADHETKTPLELGDLMNGEVRSGRQKTKVQRGGPRSDKEGNKIQQKRVLGQLF